MSRKKKEQRKDDKLQKICDEEPPTPKFLTDRRSTPRPFKGENGEWHCGNDSCMIDNVELFDLGDGLHICGHCYREFNL